jgi:hypothetical protein
MDCPLTGRTLACLPGPTLRIETITDPADLPAEWNALVSADHPLLGVEWMQAARQALPSDAQSRCVLVRDGDTLIAAAFFEAIPMKLGSLGVLESTISWQSRAALRLLSAAHCGTPHVVVCGDIIRNDIPGAHFAPGVPQPAGIFHAMAEAARVDMGVSTLMVIASARSLGPHADRLTDHGYHRIDKAEPPMEVVLDPDWSTFDDYLRAMRPKYRQRARSARKRATEVQRRWLAPTEVTAHRADFAALLSPILEQASVTLSAPDGDTVVALKQTLGEACRVRAYHHEGSLVAFAVSLHSKEAVEGLLVGFDPQRNRDLKLYQNILYDFIEVGIESGATRTCLGRTALEIKSAVGATPSEVPVYIRHPSFWMHSVLGWAAGGLPTPEWTARNPFREQAIHHAAAR